MQKERHLVEGEGAWGCLVLLWVELVWYWPEDKLWIGVLPPVLHVIGLVPGPLCWSPEASFHWSAGFQADGMGTQQQGPVPVSYQAVQQGCRDYLWWVDEFHTTLRNLVLGLVWPLTKVLPSQKSSRRVELKFWLPEGQAKISTFVKPCGQLSQKYHIHQNSFPWKWVTILLWCSLFLSKVFPTVNTVVSRS